MASRLVEPVSIRRLMNACASGWMRAWVIAMRWSAALVCRFPPRLSRNRLGLADQTGIGGDSCPHGVGVSVGESGDIGGFSNEFACGECSAAGDGEQAWCQVGDTSGDVAFKLVRLLGELANAGDFTSRYLSDDTGVGIEELLNAVESLIPVE